MDVVCELSVGSEFQHVPSSCPSRKRAFGVGTYNNKVMSCTLKFIPLCQNVK